MGEMCKLILVTLCLINLQTSISVKLPFGMRPCAREAVDFNDCVLRMINVAMTSLVKYQIGPHGESTPFNVNLTTNFQGNDLSLNVVGKEKSLVTGLEGTAINNFKFDLANKMMSFEVSIPEMRVDAPCTVIGYIGSRRFTADHTGTIEHFAMLDYSGSFEFSFSLKTNSSGTFLAPTLSSYEGQRGTATFKMENLFPKYSPASDYEVKRLETIENTGAGIYKKLFTNIIGSVVPQMISVILDMNTYDEFYPEGQYVPDSASTLTSSCLGLVIGYSAVILRGV